jgi:hypothetical protein
VNRGRRKTRRRRERREVDKERAPERQAATWSFGGNG